jgi:hypothetical protein
MLTTAGILCSSIGARDGKGCPSINAGKPAANKGSGVDKQIEKTDLTNRFFINTVFIKSSLGGLKMIDRQYRGQNV